MDRLIYREADGDLTCRSRDFEKVFPTLYAYEETGLTPDQAKALSDNLDAMTGFAQDLSDKLEQLKKERDALAAELKEEMYRHDRYVDFELAEAEELRQLKELWDVLPAHIQAKAREVRDLNKVQELFAEDNNVPSKEEA